MITALSIQNYALIDDIKVSFKNGLTAITGETGAGKSILLGALSLLLGKRADMSAVKDPTKKCIIEGDFFIQQYGLQPLFEAEDLDYENHTIIRREILPSGKSRAFVNDTPVNLQQLQALGAYLVDIHNQHETRSLLHEQQQLEVIDAVAGNSDLLQVYAENLHNYNGLLHKLEVLISEKETATKELDYHTFLYNELQEANLQGINQSELEALFEQLNNSESIQEGLAAVNTLFSEESMGTLETAKEARTILGRIKGFGSKFDEYWERLNSVIIELEDLNEAIEQSAEELEADPKKLAQIQERLQIVYKLQQKHAVSTVEELEAIEADLATKIDTTHDMDQQIAMLEASVATAKESLVEISEKIRGKREEAVPKLKQRLETLLSQLGLPNAQFQFNLQASSGFKENGADRLTLLFTANKGTEVAELKKVVSGGELSRIMLAIRAVLADHKKLPTLIFDEIDTGVSGAIAQKMADIMEVMSRSMQLFSITHLPQIAAKGNQQLKVYKEDLGKVTTTQLKELTEAERIVEIAQMIGGTTVTDSALAHAKQLRN